MITKDTFFILMTKLITQIQIKNRVTLFKNTTK